MRQVRVMSGLYDMKLQGEIEIIRKILRSDSDHEPEQLSLETKSTEQLFLFAMLFGPIIKVVKVRGLSYTYVYLHSEFVLCYLNIGR